MAVVVLCVVGSHSAVFSQQTHLAMAMASMTTLLPTRCSAALACRPRGRVTVSSDSPVPPVKQPNPDSAVDADGACVSWNASSEVQGNGIGRRGVMMSAAASAVLLFAVEDSKGEIQRSVAESGSSRKQLVYRIFMFLGSNSRASLRREFYEIYFLA